MFNGRQSAYRFVCPAKTAGRSELERFLSTHSNTTFEHNSAVASPPRSLVTVRTRQHWKRHLTFQLTGGRAKGGVFAYAKTMTIAGRFSAWLGCGLTGLLNNLIHALPVCDLALERPIADNLPIPSNVSGNRCYQKPSHKRPHLRPTTPQAETEPNTHQDCENQIHLPIAREQMRNRRCIGTKAF